jgi:ATP-dependent DNA helicase RecQ
MSATFSGKSVRLLEELFGIAGGDVARVNGCFLRPEPQYAVEEVSEEDHLEAVVNAVITLPKPAIVYVLFPAHAETILRELQRIGITRVRAFTGNTPPDQREELVRGWARSEFDIVVATSAFGLGMDKSNIRSVIHAAVPENIDRYYQEVGRGGRDGRASQSLIIYHKRQIKDAQKLNTQRLITIDRGFEKWKSMWKHGEALSTGGRKIDISTIRGDQSAKTLGNEEWNWRTLLLMQRAGLIQIEMSRPTPPDSAGQASDEQYRDSLKEYYDKYYETVMVTPLIDNIDSRTVWSDHTSYRRDFEKRENTKALTSLLAWLESPNSTRLCDTLLDYYSVSGIQPEYACGGCPCCLSSQRHINLPTVGCSANATGVSHQESWSRVLRDAPPRKYVYFSSDARSSKRLVREWSSWLRRLIETRVIEAVSADANVLKVLAKELKTRDFWIGEVLRDESDGEYMFWPRLIIYTDKAKSIPRLGYTPSVSLVLGPEEAPDADNPNRRWWESMPNAVSLDNFLLSLES